MWNHKSFLVRLSVGRLSVSFSSFFADTYLLDSFQIESCRVIVFGVRKEIVRTVRGEPRIFTNFGYGSAFHGIHLRESVESGLITDLENSLSNVRGRARNALTHVNVNINEIYAETFTCNM